MTRKTLNKWVKALRSGKFKQARSKLRGPVFKYDDKAVADCSPVYSDEDELIILHPIGYCCLGVLAEVCPQKEAPIDLETSSLLSAEYLDKIGLSEQTQAMLSHMNDTGKNFKRIARYLENRFNKLVAKEKG
jgi:hypothetical protein